jgi:hypothetical protein
MAGGFLPGENDKIIDISFNTDEKSSGKFED